MNFADRIPEDKMFEIVEDVIAMGVRAVTFSGGGEPLLYKPLPEVVRRLALGGIRVATLTNGANLKGKMAEAFAQYGTWVRVSTDAWDDASFAKSRGVRVGDFSGMLRNIRNFSALDSKCSLGVSFIVDQTNYNHIYEACALFKANGVQHVKLSGVVVGNSGKCNEAYHAPIRDAAAAQIRLASNLSDAQFAVVNHYHDLDQRFDKKYTTCPYLLFLTVIGADCQVYSCQDKAFTTSGALGSIKERRFRDFWHSEESRRRVFGLNPSNECTHHCVSNAKNLMINEFLAIDPDHSDFV